MTTLLIATRNAHKVGEIQSILGAPFQFLTLNDFSDAPKVVEDADTFAGNATKKSVELARWLSAAGASRLTPHASRFFVLADDSGLEVDALGGAPGVHSARFAALDPSADGSSANSTESSPDADNNAKLLRLLKDMPPEKRIGRFHCVIALSELHPPSSILHPQIFDGACAGRIQFSASGHGGFGYDPLFAPDGFNQSFAELGEDAKNQLSH